MVDNVPLAPYNEDADTVHVHLQLCQIYIVYIFSLDLFDLNVVPTACLILIQTLNKYQKDLS